MNKFWTGIRWVLMLYVTATVLLGLVVATSLALPVVALERAVLRVARGRTRVA